MTDLRAEIRFKNAVLWRAIQEQFGEEAAKIQRRAGVSPVFRLAAQYFTVNSQTLSDFLCLRESPWSLKTKLLKPSAQRIADGLGISPAELFPPSLYALQLPQLIVKEFDSPEILSLQQASGIASTLPSPEDSAMVHEHRRLIDAALLTVNPRAENILRMRFGLDREQLTLQECADVLGIHKERVRQLESQALSRLRSCPPDKPARAQLREVWR